MLDRKTPPPFNRSTTFDLLQPKKITLENGLTIFFISGGQQEVIKVELIFQGGRWFENAWGAAYFSSHLLTKGTTRKTSFDIAQSFDRYGAHVEMTPGLDVVSVALYSLTRNLSSSLELLIEILSDATFPEKELDQLKSQYIQNLKVNQEKTSFLASTLFRKKLFGETHPYGKELDEHDVTNLTRQQLVAHAASYFTDLKVFVSGKIDHASERTLASCFASLPYLRVGSKLIESKPRQTFHHQQAKEGSVQASIRMGKKSVLRNHPDFAEILFLTHILGGYFGSRLMKNIREEKGLTYGIHASLNAWKHESFLIIGTDVNKENIALTLDEVRMELNRLGTGVIDLNELNTARNHFIGSLQAEISTPFAHADKIKNLNVFNLEAAYYQQLINRIERLTPEDLRLTGEKYFAEDSFSTVAVG